MFVNSYANKKCIKILVIDSCLRGNFVYENIITYILIIVRSISGMIVQNLIPTKFDKIKPVFTLHGKCRV